MSALHTLLSPMSYLRIKHPLKRLVDIWFPIAGLTIVVPWTLLWPSFNIFGTSGLAANINGLLQILSGFFITSLAAVATFNGSVYNIDQVFEGEKALLDGDALTRRQFICLLFAYLALTSIILYLFGAFGLAAASTLHTSNIVHIRVAMRVMFASVYCVTLAHVLGTTLVGLIFLSQRLPGSGARQAPLARPRTGMATQKSTAASNLSKPATPDAPAPHP